MSNIQITRDEAGKKIIVEKTLPATVGEVWAAYSDGDVMAKWWGPKTWPASSISFDFTPGGHWRYCMTGPDGTKACGKLEYTSVDAPNSFSAKDAFTDEAGNVNATLPSTDWRVTFEEQGNTTKVTSELSFSSAADMQKIIDMGFEAGFTESMSNLEEYLGR